MSNTPGSEIWDARYRERPLVWSAGPNQFVGDDGDRVAIDSLVLARRELSG